MMTTRWWVLLGAGALFGAVGCSSSGGGTDAGGDTGSPADSGGGGDSGGGTVSCASYCAAVMGACTGANQQYPDNATCMAACAALPLGTTADTAVDSVGCRQYHAGAAAGGAMAAATHCQHSGPWGGGVCGSECEGYCAIETKLCTGGNQQFGSASACQTACMAWTGGDAGSASGNSLACREYHMLVAVTQQSAHCPHTGNGAADAGNPCGP